MSFYLKGAKKGALINILSHFLTFMLKEHCKHDFYHFAFENGPFQKSCCRTPCTMTELAVFRFLVKMTKGFCVCESAHARILTID